MLATRGSLLWPNPFWFVQAMGHFHQDYQNASADLVEYYGQPILYSDRSLDEPVSVDAKVYSERQQRRQNDHGWYWTRTREIELLRCEQEIRSDGTFTIYGEDYAVDEIGQKDGDRTRVSLTKAQAGEINRPGYRGN